MAAIQVAGRMGIHASLRRIALPAGIALAVFGLGAGLFRLWLGTSVLSLVTALLVLGLIYLAALFLLRRRLGLDVVFTRSAAKQDAEPAPAQESHGA
jgi:hypothetical protein